MKRMKDQKKIKQRIKTTAITKTNMSHKKKKKTKEVFR